MRQRCLLFSTFLGVGALLSNSAAHAEVGYPAGTQDFESLGVGVSVESLPGWVFVNTSAPPDQFTVVGANDGGPPPGLTSSRWLRLTDTDGTNVQNRFYSPDVTAPQVEDYIWTFHVKLESTPPGGIPAKPRITIQHLDVGFSNAWGIEFTDSGANVIVTGIGGPAASAPLYELSGDTDVGDWVKLRLRVRFSDNTVAASANGGPFVSLPISLAGEPRVFRFCYRGEGAGNTAQILFDDVSVSVGDLAVPAVSTWGLVTLALLLAVGAKMVVRQRVGAAC